jgi:hypothetical protein
MTIHNCSPAPDDVKAGGYYNTMMMDAIFDFFGDKWIAFYASDQSTRDREPNSTVVVETSALPT